MAALVFGLSPADPVTYAVVAALLVVAAFVATLIPARAATRVDPMVASLRTEHNARQRARAVARRERAERSLLG